MKSFFLRILNFPTAIRIKTFTFVNRFFLRTKGIIVGKKCTILGKVSIIGPGKITIGDNFCMTSGEHINPICANSQGSFFTDSPNAKITIGNNVGMSSTRMWIHDSLTIGDNVQIGANVLLIDTDTHQIDYRLRRHPEDEIFNGQSIEDIWEKKRDNTISAPIFIEDDVWIGAHVIVLKGVTIGARSVIGAGSVVTKDIPSDCIAAGNPCKVIRKIK